MKIVDGRVHKAKITDSRQLVNGKAAAAGAATADIMKTLAGVQASEAKRSQDSTHVVTDENSVNASFSGRRSVRVPLQALNEGPRGRSTKEVDAMELRRTVWQLFAAKAAKLQTHFEKLMRLLVIL